MIWATWRMHRSIFIASIAAAIALAVWLAITGGMEEHAWTIFTSHHCSLNYPGSSAICMSSLSGADSFSTVNAALCGALPALLGLVLGVPLVAGEIQQRTNRLAWTQSITRTRWLLTKIGVGALFTAAIVGALAPLFWWWTDAAQRSSHIQPANFDISGFVGVAYALFAFMLGVALGALIRRAGWAFAACVPIFALVRIGIRLYIRPGLIPPTTVSVSAYTPVNNSDCLPQYRALRPAASNAACQLPKRRLNVLLDARPSASYAAAVMVGFGISEATLRNSSRSDESSYESNRSMTKIGGRTSGMNRA